MGSSNAQSAVIVTYHAVEWGPAPLCIDPVTFLGHVDCIAESGVESVTVSELARRLRAGESLQGVVALTFDDGFASVARTAVPLLAERGLTATVFCVAGRLGRDSGWASAPRGGFLSPLVSGDELAELARAGFEIGSHTMAHAPLVQSDPEALRREIVESRAVLEGAVGTAVRSFAYPYGAGPAPAARRLVAETYDAACTTEMRRVQPGDDPLELPRIDAHYIRRPQLLRSLLAGSLGVYIGARGLGARARRALRKDYRLAEAS